MLCCAGRTLVMTPVGIQPWEFEDPRSAFDNAEAREELRMTIRAQTEASNMWHAADKRGDRLAPDTTNWLGIVPREVFFTEEEILRGEVQCAIVHLTVVYLTRNQAGPTLAQETFPFKVTTWAAGRLLHREVFITLHAAQHAFTEQRRLVATELAVKVLTHKADEA